MVDAVFQSIALAMIVAMLFKATREGEILSFAALLTYNWHPWIRKALHGCLPCMTFWWGIPVVILFQWTLIVPLIAAGMNLFTEKLLGDGED